jgi:hypothetical protein
MLAAGPASVSLCCRPDEWSPRAASKPILRRTFETIPDLLSLHQFLRETLSDSTKAAVRQLLMNASCVHYSHHQCRGRSLDRHENPLGTDHHRFCHRACRAMGRNSVDRMAARASAATRTTVVRGRRDAGLHAGDVFLVVVPLRCLCAPYFHRGCGDCSLRRLRIHRYRDWHVGLASPRSQDDHDLWVGTLGNER